MGKYGYLVLIVVLAFGGGCKKKEFVASQTEEQKESKKDEPKKESKKDEPKKESKKTPMGRVLDMKAVEDGCLISTESTINPTLIRGGCPAFFKDETAEHDITIENTENDSFVSEWVCFNIANLCSRVN